MDETVTLLAGFGGLAVALAAAAWFADRRRMRRSDPDAFGWMPWTGVFFWALLAAVVLFGLSARAWLAG